MRRLHVLHPPACRADCIAGTPDTGSRADRVAGRASCLVLTCRENLLRTDADDVPGRRRNGVGPEWTLNGECRGSCAMDYAELGPMKCRDMAKVLGVSKRRVQQEVKAALANWVEAVADSGEDPRVALRDVLAMQERDGE